MKEVTRNPQYDTGAAAQQLQLQLHLHLLPKAACHAKQEAGYYYLYW
jgi:hypothetical protein